jgi:hypothetical protein
VGAVLLQAAGAMNTIRPVALMTLQAPAADQKFQMTIFPSS